MDRAALDPSTRQSRRQAAAAALRRAQEESYDRVIGEEIESAIDTDLQLSAAELEAFNAQSKINRIVPPPAEETDPDLYRDSEPPGSPFLILAAALVLWAVLIFAAISIYSIARGPL